MHMYVIFGCLLVWMVEKLLRVLRSVCVFVPLLFCPFVCVFCVCGCLCLLVCLVGCIGLVGCASVRVFVCLLAGLIVFVCHYMQR